MVYASSGARRKSERSRRISGPVKKLRFDGQVAIPKQESSLAAVQETEAVETKRKRKKSELLESDRGRLFVRVLGVKHITLPRVAEKQAKFNVVLDNGVQELVTPFRSLSGENAAVDQEFELVAGSARLDINLTMRAKWPRAGAQVPSRSKQHLRTPSIASNSTEASDKSARKLGGFSKLFGKKKSPAPSSPVASPRLPQTANATYLPVKDAWDDLTDTDGSFGRVQISLADHEDKIYGKAQKFELPIANHWSVITHHCRRTPHEPYQVGILQVQMMFVPRVSKQEQLPHSIAEALTQLQTGRAAVQSEKKAVADREKAEAARQIELRRNAVQHEGYLSQLGGDCTYWRRRFFKLDGCNLTAYSESRKPRISINLVKATQVVADKSTLTRAPGKNRRKSAFAEQEEGFMFVDSGFRVKFENGEVIDFYAEDSEDKQRWVGALKNAVAKSQDINKKTALIKEEQTVSLGGQVKPWVELVLNTE